MLSIASDSSVSYPSHAEYFSPHERYPEYRYDHVASAPNSVYSLVRTCLAQAGLDRENFGTSDWNPLGVFAPPRSSVFVLANFVQEELLTQRKGDINAKCTHGSVLRAILDYLLIAVGPNGRVTFGNAALQNCNWGLVFRQTGTDKVSDFYTKQGVEVRAMDLRLATPGSGGCDAADDRGVNIDLGMASLLEPLYRRGSPQFRVTNYNSDRTMSYHARGKHVYVLHREVLDADLVVSVPKLKTHEKVGITCALKGCVGAVGCKDCLPHHRFGSSVQDGDEYPIDRLGLLRAMSVIHEWVYKTDQTISGRFLRGSDRMLQRLKKRLVPETGGAWWGNDTAWRMALDLARIIRYCAGGELRARPAREHLVLIDGIVGGEGAGPLKPRPIDSRVLMFGDNPASADYASAVWMGFEPLRLPIVRESLTLEDYPLLDRLEREIILNGSTLPLEQLGAAAERPFLPPPGWAGHIERKADEIHVPKRQAPRVEPA